VYDYDATVINVVDGDTFDAQLQLGFYLTATLRLRVLGINAPEMHGPSHEAGAAAKAFAGSLLREGAKVVLHTEKSDDFGRWLAKVTLPDGSDFGQTMIDTQHAVPYDPRKGAARP
jgi:micrococcal nuclease